MTKPFDPFNQCTEYYYRIEKLLADNTALKAENESLRKDMLAAAQEENNRLRMALADTEALEAGTAETNQKLRDQLAKAEQRVAEAIVDMLQQKHRNYFGAHSLYWAASVATANGEWRKFVKEV